MAKRARGRRQSVSEWHVFQPPKAEQVFDSDRQSRHSASQEESSGDGRTAAAWTTVIFDVICFRSEKLGLTQAHLRDFLAVYEMQ